jgi:hypothetical protein
VICLDQMGPEAAKSFPGQQLVRTASVTEQQPPAERARQEIDYGRRGKGYIFGAFRPGTGEAFTQPYTGRTIANWSDFLERVDTWVPQETAPIYAILDNLNVHRATDVLLFSLAHPRWEFVFQPTYAAYLNLIEPWWKCCGRWRSKAAASTPGNKCVKPLRQPRRTGTPIGILLFGGSVAGIGRVENLASRRCQKQHRFAGCTT